MLRYIQNILKMYAATFKIEKQQEIKIENMTTRLYKRHIFYNFYIKLFYIENTTQQQIHPYTEVSS